MALGAKAHRNIAYKYHRMLYGMVYALLIKGTGMGKGLSTDLCRGLMPDWYVIRDAVQSGPALAPLLADIVRDKKGKAESCTAHPALLLIEEFTVLLKNAGIQHSTLIDSLNSLFHRPWPWNISRTDRPGGGGDVKIENPTLSILATTTEALFKEYVSPQMIRSGFLNRYLVLPGDTTPWKFYDPEGAGKIIHQNLGLFDYIPIREMGAGKTVWDAYVPPAFARLRSWGEETFEPIMQSSELEAESVKRLHVYAHVIGLLYAWGEGRALVTLDDVECSITVIETSQRFLQALITQDREPEVPKFKAYEISLEERILARVTEAQFTRCETTRRYSCAPPPRPDPRPCGIHHTHRPDRDALRSGREDRPAQRNLRTNSICLKIQPRQGGQMSTNNVNKNVNAPKNVNVNNVNALTVCLIYTEN